MRWGASSGEVVSYVYGVPLEADFCIPAARPALQCLRRARQRLLEEILTKAPAEAYRYIYPAPPSA